MKYQLRPTWADVDLAAFADNVAALAALAAPAGVCAVVKADAYGHGAVRCARAAVAAGAVMLGVALVEEAAVLRRAGIAAPILLLSEPPAGCEAVIVDLDVEPTVYTSGAIARFAGVGAPVAVHLKVDTGMHRVGAPPDAALDLAVQIVAAPALRLAGTWTHFAAADEPGNPVTAEQVALFEQTLDALADAGIEPGTRHMANTAALLTDPAAHAFDMVRCGIGLYGIAPSTETTEHARGIGLRPVMALRSHLSHVARLSAGSRVSYGLRYTLAQDAWIGTVPIGYADGVRRGLSNRMDVLVRGRRRPIAGTVTMDQLLVDLGDTAADPGEEVVLIGAQGNAAIRVEDWADVLGTIGYEITCGISPRVPRHHHLPGGTA